MNELTKGLNDAFKAAEDGLKHAKAWENDDRGKNGAKYFHACYKNVCEEIMTILSLSLEAHNKTDSIVVSNCAEPQPIHVPPVTEKRIIDYKIVCYTSDPQQGPDGQMYPVHKTLQQNVVESLATGWELYGSPFTDEDGDTCQAMVTYE